MYCRKCGNFIPDDSNFCPNCGAKVEPTIVNPTNQQTAKPLSKLDVLKLKLDKFSPQKLNKVIYFSTIFQINTILSFVGIFLFFAASPIFAAIDEKSSGAWTFRNIYFWFLVIYSIALMVTTIWTIILLVKYKKEFEIINAKIPIIFKSIYIALLLAICVMLILDLIYGISMDEAKGMAISIPTMIFLGLCFCWSGINGSMSQTFIIVSKKILKKIYPERYK